MPTFFTIQNVDVTRITQLAQTTRPDPVFVERILRTVSNVFTDHSANVVGLVLQCTVPGGEHTVDAICALHRMCVLIQLFVWGKYFVRSMELVVQHVPHKKKRCRARQFGTVGLQGRRKLSNLQEGPRKKRLLVRGNRPTHAWPTHILEAAWSGNSLDVSLGDAWDGVGHCRLASCIAHLPRRDVRVQKRVRA